MTLTADAARRAARNAGAIAAARIISSGSQFIWQLILAGALGEADFGVYGAVSSLFGIGAVVTNFAMSMILIRDVARAPEKAGRYLAAALSAQTVLALVAYIGMTAAAGYDPVIQAFAAIAGISLFIDLVGTLAYDQLLAQERMVTTSAVEITQIAARIGIAALLLALGFGLLGVYIAAILSGIIRAAILWFALRRTGVRPQFPVDWAILRPLLIDAAPLAAFSFINMTYARIDTILTSGILTNADAGHFNAAFVIIAGVVELLSTTILVAIYPFMSRAQAEQPELFRTLVEKLAAFTLIIGVPLGLVFTLFAPAIILPLFGASYAPTADILRALIWYAITTMVVNVFAQALMAANRQRRLLVFRVGGLVVKLALSLILLPRVGVVGAALASAFAETALLIILALDFPIDAQRLVPRLLRLVIAGVVGVGGMLALGTLNPFIGMIGGGLAYLAVVVWGGVLAPDDWDLLYRLAAALPGGSLIRRVWRRDTVVNW